MKGKYSRTGARRSGDDYQDLLALEVLVEWLEHPDRYQWVCVEADDAGVLDDIVALKSDDGFVAKQVKFSTRPESESDAWTWKDLLERRKGKKEKLPSLLAKWATSLERLHKVGNVSERTFEELLEIHFHNSRELQSRLRNRTLFELLGEELPFTCFQGRGCPNRTGSDGQDPYITAVATLIRYVYECNRSYFDSVASNKITEILKGRQRAQGRGLRKD